MLEDKVVIRLTSKSTQRASHIAHQEICVLFLFDGHIMLHMFNIVRESKVGANGTVTCDLGAHLCHFGSDLSWEDGHKSS